MNLHPKPGKPYYIVAPAYETKSAGAKVLHLLCHALNLSGQRAFIVPMGNVGLSPNLITPLAPEIYDRDSVIAIYPEIVHGNPLGTKNVVRYLLYFAGAYGGPKDFEATDMVWAYSTPIARHAFMDNVLTLPCVDMDVFKPSSESRSGSCFYANKYRFVYGGQLLPITEGSTEITQSMTREEIISILQKSEVFYAYEDTALILEAVLCGCPAVLLNGEFFKQCVGLEDFGRNGVAWGIEELGHAKATIDFARADYMAVNRRFVKQLEHFIVETQNAKQE